MIVRSLRKEKHARKAEVKSSFLNLQVKNNPLLRSQFTLFYKKRQ